MVRRESLFSLCFVKENLYVLEERRPGAGEDRDEEEDGKS